MGVGRQSMTKRTTSAASSRSSGAPPNPPCGIASKTCSSTGAPRASQLAVKSHSVREEQVAGSALQERRREVGRYFSEKRGQIGMRQLCSICVEQVVRHQRVRQDDVDGPVGLKAVTRLGQVHFRRKQHRARRKRQALVPHPQDRGHRKVAAGPPQPRAIKRPAVANEGR